MSKFHVEIACEGAAFEDGRHYELANILHLLAYRLNVNGLRPDGRDGPIKLRDTNGNVVGAARLVE